MKIDITKFLNTLTKSLDYAESAVISVARYHGKRVSVLTTLMAKEYGFDRDTLYAITVAAVLHDCALSEYLKDEFDTGKKTKLDEKNMHEHCSAGEKLLLKLPVYQSIKGSVLYHHERADGKGAFGKTADETPIIAQLIHIADIVDVNFSLDEVDEEKYKNIIDFINSERNKCFSNESADLFIKAIDCEALESIAGEGCRKIIKTMLPEFVDDIDSDILREMASFIGKITDYKSHFTWRHSIGIAEKAETIGKFYGYDNEMCNKLYIAGSLHDIGKLLISNNILEKPGKLTSDEYKEIQNHAMGTWKLLSGISGLEDISRWAAYHHEKLDGSGYPFGYTEKDLDKHDRLFACLDIYQALVEERPYKNGMSHKEAMDILYRMGNDGQLDMNILKDIDACFVEDEEDGAKNNNSINKEYAGEAWRCPVCGYVYEGALPEDFICPQCEQPSSVFEKIRN